MGRRREADWASEGNSLDNRWKWNETIGPVEDRPGREGNKGN